MNELVCDITQSIEIDANLSDSFDAILKRLTTENSTPDNQPMPMVLEERPGGRWYRDLGDEQGHLWGFVQVIKPPRLLEIHGPMFMSYAVAGHLQLRLEEQDSKTVLTLRHQVLGNVRDEHRQGMTHGWNHFMQTAKTAAES